MEVQEGNKLIAIFDGYVEKDGQFWRNHAWTVLSHLNYDTKWERLMPVVEKIENIGIDPPLKTYGEYRVCIEQTACRIYRLNEQSVAKDFGAKKIDAVWGAVVQFIQWYNNSPSGTISKQ